MKKKFKPHDVKLKLFHSVDQMDVWSKYNSWTDKEKPCVLELNFSTCLSVRQQYSFVIVVWYNNN